MKTIYQQLKGRVLHLLEGYREDLTKHDRNWLEANPDTPFLHATRRLGTDLLELCPADQYPAKGELVPYLFGEADREHMARGIVSVAEGICGPCASHRLAYHYFDGKTLYKIGQSRFLTLAQDYVRHTLCAFRA